MFTKEWLERVGIPQEDMTEYLSHSREICFSGLTPTIVGSSWYRRMKAHVERVRKDAADNELISRGHTDFNSWVAHSPSCCGVVEFSNLVGVNQAFKECVILHFLLQRGIRFFVYYSIRDEDTKHFKEIGFKEIEKFINPNTRREITLLTLSLPWTHEAQ